MDLEIKDLEWKDEESFLLLVDELQSSMVYDSKRSMIKVVKPYSTYFSSGVYDVGSESGVAEVEVQARIFDSMDKHSNTLGRR